MIRSIESRVLQLEERQSQDDEFRGLVKADLQWMKKLLYILLTTTITTAVGIHLVDTVSLFHP